MTRTLLPCLALLAACGGSKSPPQAADDATPSPYAEVEAEVTAAMDPAADPCVDFYQYACGGWLESTELPADKPRVSRSFTTISDRNRETVKSILEAAASGEIEADPRLGTYYEGCKDTAAIDAEDDVALKADLATIAAAEDKASLLAMLGELPRSSAFMGGGVFPDFLDPDTNMFHLGQGGLGLPERDAYFPEDDEAKAILAAYEAHVGTMLELAGLDPAGAAAVVALETKLAEASRRPAEMRDPTTMYHPTAVADLPEMAPAVPWEGLMSAYGLDVETVNVLTPEFFPALSTVVEAASLEDLQTYMAWHHITSMAPYASSALDAENFAFYGTTLNGQQAQEPRWKRCVSRTDGSIGDLLGQAWVDQNFAGESKELALAMVGDVEAAFAMGLNDLAWMDDETRPIAKSKLDAIAKKIGYPDTWESYDGLEITGDHYADAMAVAAWGLDDQIAKVGEPVDKTEWGMSPPTVNAYYNPLNNEIAFPAGILQAPFFDKDFPTAMNYGAIGMVIGHEITHGFDDSGRKFDPDGKMQAWWSDEVSTAFEEQAACVEGAYEGFETIPGVTLNGKLTLGENIADLGGIKLASTAYDLWQARQGEDGEETLAGFEGDQLVFLAFAQGWCTLATDELTRQRAKTDSHSPPKQRVNIPLQHTAAFWDAFSCEEGTPMHPTDTCTVW